MGPEIMPKVKKEAFMEVSRGTEEKINSLRSASSCQDKTFDMEPLSVGRTVISSGSENMEVDVIGCSGNGDDGPNGECNVSTENSSSFGDTVSGTDYGLLLDDEEVESQLYGGDSLRPMSNGYREVFPRKKKLTVHWRKFISPHMWRCRWLELQIKKLQSQAFKYDRELALYDQRKQSIYENFSMEGFDVKSIGFSSHTQRHRVMKRKRRKKTEETTDVASYMANHNLFSYYEKNRSMADNMALEDTLDKTRNMRIDDYDFGTNATEGWEPSMLGGDDTILEDIFLKIEALQSKVHMLKNRIDKVVNENPMKFASINELNFFESSDPSSTEDGNDALVRSLHEASQHISEHAFGDVLMPESVNKNHGEVILLPDMIQSADCGSTQKVLVQNCAVKEELQFSEEVKGESTDERPQELEEQKTIPPAAVSEADLASKNTELNLEHETKPLPAAKTNTSKKTKKRGRRKTGLSKRNQKATG